jgi:hypothetical protein
MVPLDKVLRKPGAEPVPGFVLPELRPSVSEAEPRKPRAFKVIDVMTHQALAEGVDIRQAIQALEGVRSIVDVSVYVWVPQVERWRKLTFGETQGLWEHRGRLSGVGEAASDSPGGAGDAPIE